METKSQIFYFGILWELAFNTEHSETLGTKTNNP